jgi:hypothetical protein
MPLEALSPRGKEIHDAVREKIMKNADSYPPGLLEQYKIQLRRIEEQAPASELISIPGFMSYPNPPKPVRVVPRWCRRSLTSNARTGSI